MCLEYNLLLHNNYLPKPRYFLMKPQLCQTMPSVCINLKLVTTWTIIYSSSRQSDEYIYIYIYASINWVTTGSDNGLLSVQHQAIICTYELASWPFETNLNETKKFSSLSFRFSMYFAWRTDQIYLHGSCGSMKKMFSVITKHARPMTIFNDFSNQKFHMSFSHEF